VLGFLRARRPRWLRCVLGVLCVVGLAACGTRALAPDVGVPCGAAACASGKACCVDQSAGSSRCVEESTSEDQCPSGMIIRCDGPEDCPSGERCLAKLFGEVAGVSVPSLTECYSDVETNISATGVLVCHDAGDCLSGVMCTPEAPLVSGAPQLGLCEPQ
jgi:hypothetical protein